MGPEDGPRFIIDLNCGKLAKWLRMIGYDARLFDHRDDKYLIHTALAENRIIITRDTKIMLRRVVVMGQLKALLVTSDEPLRQIRQVIKALDLNPDFNPFSLCLECNQPLVKISKEDVKDRIPPYVSSTQSQYVECPDCRRVYWQGTHWQSMVKKLDELIDS
jgi:uncharacterized protein